MQIIVSGLGGNQQGGANVRSINLGPLNNGQWYYYRWNMNLDSNFKWGTGTGYTKAARMKRVDEEPTLKIWTGYIGKQGVFVNNSAVLPPYYDPDAIRIPFSFESTAGTGWHEYIVAMKMQTGQNGSDGEFSFFVDGKLVGKKNDIHYLDYSGDCSDAWRGWMVSPYFQLNGTENDGGLMWLDDYSMDDQWNSEYPFPNSDTSAPSIPTNLIVVSATVEMVKLQWDPSTDKSDSLYYEIFRNDSLIGSTTLTNFIDTSVQHSVTYSYNVEAVNGFGKRSGPSSPVSVSIQNTSIFEQRISDGNNDIEEFSDGSVFLNSSDLELVYDSFYLQNQIVGLRFIYLTIPKNARILNAYLEFEVDEVSTSATSLSIHVEAADNANAFTGNAHAVSSRTFESNYITWNNVEAWSAVDAKKLTPDISLLVQSVVNRSGWTSGNSLVLKITGTGSRIAESVEGEAAAAPLLHVEYTVDTIVNHAPIVSAGQSQTIILPINQVTLQGSISDDGLPTGSILTSQWTQISGSSIVVFSDKYSTVTNAYFPDTGSYVLSLTASDGALQTSSTVSITVLPDLDPPSVPTNLLVISSDSGIVKLQWSPSTDNSGILQYEIFRDDSLIGNTASTFFNDSTAQVFTTHLYSVQAVDSMGNKSGLSIPVSATVHGISRVLEQRITSGINDVEEFANGTVVVNSSDLELVYDSDYHQNQIVGLRFTSITIPKNALISKAYIEFEVDEVTTSTTSLIVSIEASNNASVFSNSEHTVSSRSFSPVTASWSNVESWNVVNSKQKSADISSLIQSIVDRSGWTSGNALVLKISGSGTRTAESVEGETAAAPLIHIEYESQ
jgi:hypothetical protein